MPQMRLDRHARRRHRHAPALPQVQRNGVPQGWLLGAAPGTSSARRPGASEAAPIDCHILTPCRRRSGRVRVPAANHPWPGDAGPGHVQPGGPRPDGPPARRTRHAGAEGGQTGRDVDGLAYHPYAVHVPPVRRSRSPRTLFTYHPYAVHVPPVRDPRTTRTLPAYLPYSDPSQVDLAVRPT